VKPLLSALYEGYVKTSKLGLLLCVEKMASLKKLKEGPGICGADHWRRCLTAYFRVLSERI